jgi:hypothetical protein
MNKALWAMTLVWLTGYAMPGFTQGSGVDLLKQCTQAVKAINGVVDPTTIDFGDAGRCMGLIEGFAGAAAFYESKPGSPGAICFPTEGTTIGQSVRMVDKFLQSHPEQLHEPSTVLIFGAFVSAYPCP